MPFTHTTGRLGGLLQVLALFSRAEIEWPPLMRAMFTFFSAFNFNVDITAPECLIPNLDYQLKWWFIMLIPMAAMSFLCLAFIVELLHDAVRGKKILFFQKFGNVIAQYLLMMYYVYLAVTRRALDVFNCNPSSPPDGYYYTEFTSIDCEGGLCKCGIKGSVQVTLQPWAIFFICFYTLGFPLFLAVVIYRNYDLIKEDQILRAHNLQVWITKLMTTFCAHTNAHNRTQSLQDIRESNPKAFDI